MNKEKIDNKKLYDKLKDIEELLKISLRANSSNKFQLLLSEVQSRKRLNVQQIQTLLGGVSRNWALELMKRLGREKHFKFVVGDVKLQRGSLVIYQEQEAIQENYSKIKKLLQNKEVVSFADIRNCLGLENNEIGFGFTQNIINDFVNENEGYLIQNRNKLVKIAINSPKELIGVKGVK